MQHPLQFNYLKTHPTTWEPSSPTTTNNNDMKVTMNLRLDGCIVPSEAEGGRIAYSNIVVLDNFIDDVSRRQLKDFLLGKLEEEEGDMYIHEEAKGGGSVRGDAVVINTKATTTTEEEPLGQQPQRHTDNATSYLPEHLWERKTADMAGASPTWGVKPWVLQRLASGYPPAIVEVQSRLVKLYPEFDIAHLPSEAIQQQQQQCEDDEDNDRGGSSKVKRARINEVNNDKPTTTTNNNRDDGDDDTTTKPGGVDCSAFLVNAAALGDSFIYHLDADPTSFPSSSPWVQAFGDYFNGEPGKPLLISLLIYLDDDWPRDWAADTLFLDSDTDTGVFVRPKPGRAVLMHQDVLHRVSPPSAAATVTTSISTAVVGGEQQEVYKEERPRLSLVLKLVFLPKSRGQRCWISRPEWGVPVSFGSAARVGAVMREIAKEKKQQQHVGR